MAEVERVENDPSEPRAWCDLPPEILHLIAKKLGDISDFIVFRAVCKSWRSCECDLPFQLPWILEQRQNPENPNLRFYSLFSDRIHNINCPRSRYKKYCELSYTYLLGRIETQFGFLCSLLNPITSNEINPPLFEQDTAVCGLEWIGPNPTGSGKLAVFTGLRRLNCSGVVILWRLGDHNTVQFKIKGTIGYNCLYCKGEIFFVHKRSGYTKAFDITTQKLVFEMSPIDPFRYLWNCWMVESGGEILHLCMIRDPDPNQFHFDICRLDRGSDKGHPCWVRIESIGDQVLFLDERRGFSFCACDYEAVGGNHIYLLEDRLLCKYDIKDGTAQMLNCPFVGSRKTWFIPRLF